MNQLKMLSYYDNLDNFNKLDEIIENKLNSALEKADIHTMQIAHRVKTAESISGKLTRKPDKYTTATDLTDIVGYRIICYFTDQIDLISSIIENLFVIDRDNYVDKSKMLKPNAFGYLSVHYICSLKPSDEYPQELCKFKFEIQIRTVLQHTWAEIEHDLGYKNEFGVPRHVRREFSQMASLLEVADAGFGRIKRELDRYSNIVIDRLRTGDVSDIQIDSLSLREFMRYNDEFVEFTNEIASFSGAQLTPVNADPYIRQLEFFGIEDLGALLNLINDKRSLALEMAESTLKGSEIDELASSVGLFYICRAALVSGDYSKNDIKRYYTILNTKESLIDKQVDHILKLREQYTR